MIYQKFRVTIETLSTSELAEYYDSRDEARQAAKNLAAELFREGHECEVTIDQRIPYFFMKKNLWNVTDAIYQNVERRVIE